MASTNGALKRFAKAASAGGKETFSASETQQVQSLVQTWKRLNYGRAVLTGMGALLAVIATVMKA